MSGKAFVFVECRFAVKEVASDSHIGLTPQSEAHILHCYEECIVCYKSVYDTSLGDIVSITHDELNTVGYVRHHRPYPIFRSGIAVGIGHEQKFVFRCLYTYGNRKFLSAYNINIVGYIGYI